MITYKIHLIRHGLTDANFQGTYLGRTDLSLCDAGIQDLARYAAGKEYPYVDKIYTSPLKRCRETAQILYPGRYTTDVEDLTELDFGAYEGRTLEELKDDPDFITWSRDSMHNAPPQGEDGVHFIQRLVAGLDAVFHDMMENQLRDVAVVVPGGVIMTCLALMGFPRKPMGEWDSHQGGGFTILMTPELWMRDRVFEVMDVVPRDEEDLADHWSQKKYYGDGEEMFFGE